MNGIEKIISRIGDDAQRERDAILSEARERAEAVASEYVARGQELYGAAIKEGAVAAKQQYERLVNTAQMESKKVVLNEKQTLIGEAFALAVSQLRALPKPEYTALLARLAAAASRDGTETLYFAPEDAGTGADVAAEANRLLAQSGKTAALKPGAEPRGIAGGVVVSGGETEVNCALDKLVGETRRELESAVSAALFD
ncbi:MAG: V-type ATP synthase subunit E [Oscillospiraceae bacterium]|jgi:V/A-type H+-transporting ATPase subunit E|nr:V-type ATP synthase subunit E [Oscillospiraceae bacterium]